MSPLSDSTNLASGIAGVELFDHVRHMIYTTGPSYLISLFLYFIISLKYKHGNVDYIQINEMLKIFTENFWISPILLIAPIFVILMVILKISYTRNDRSNFGRSVFFIQGYNLQK